MIYEMYKIKLHYINLAVSPKYQRKGIGTQLVNKLISKLAPARRKGIVVDLRESNLSAQLFFRQMGFKANKVNREFYKDTGEDGYHLKYVLKENDI